MCSGEEKTLAVFFDNLPGVLVRDEKSWEVKVAHARKKFVDIRST